MPDVALDELGLRAAVSLEASVGPFIALAAYRRLFASEGAVREGAILGAVRCAMLLDDEPALLACAEAWRTQPSSAAAVTEHAAALLARGRAAAALRLAAAERARSRSPRAAYVEARAADASAPREGAGEDAIDRWWAVVELARAASDAKVLALAAARYAGLAFARAARDQTFVLPRADIAAACEAADDALLGALEARLPLLAGRLLSASRFKRASALSALEAGARGGGTIGARALALVLRHVDGLGGQLTPLELDRVRAALKHLPEAVRLRVEAALQPPAIAPEPLASAGEVESAIPTLRPEASPSARIARSALTLLGAPTSEDRAVGARFVAAVLARTTATLPCPLSALGARLLEVGHTAEALRVFDEALRLREPDALRWRGFVLREQAYEAVQRREVDQAWTALDGARAILRGGPSRYDAPR